MTGKVVDARKKCKVLIKLSNGMTIKGEATVESLTLPDPLFGNQYPIQHVYPAVEEIVLVSDSISIASPELPEFIRERMNQE